MFLDPEQLAGDAGVDSGVVSHGTTFSPWDNPYEMKSNQKLHSYFVSTNKGVVFSLIGDHGAPAVSLAWILVSTSCTDHAGGDLTRSVEVGIAGALGISHGVQINLGKW